MLTQEQQKQFSDILEEFGNALDITEDQHKKAVTSYEFVGSWLSADDSPLAKFKPEILPQGSFMLGTMIRPINEDDKLDIDLVCRLEGKHQDWAQVHLKKIVGDRLKAHGVIEKLLKLPDGRRCWTLKYAEEAKFHMDVLPAIVSENYRTILEKAFSSTDFQNAESLAIRITDKKHSYYETSTNPDQWLKSNPFGYGIWFEQCASLSIQKAIMMSEAVQPVPKYRKEKLPLQRIIQILKRHRDMMFNGDEDKPISIIITTLAARAYKKQTEISDGLHSVLSLMPTLIEERYSAKHNRNIKWISNPVNPEENFADKWPENPKKEENFYKWIKQAQSDILTAFQQRGINKIQEAMLKPFGEREINKAFSNLGDGLKKLRDDRALKMASGTGTLGSIGTTIKGHNFHGK